MQQLITPKITVASAILIAIAMMAVEGTTMTFIYSTDLSSRLSPVEITTIDSCVVGAFIALIAYVLNRYHFAKYDRSLAKLGLSQAALDAMGKGVVVTGPDGEIIYINKAFEAITGYTLNDVKGKTPAILKSGKQPQEFYTGMWRDLKEHGQWRGIIWNKRKTGELYRERLNIRRFIGPFGDIGFVGVFVDLSEQDELERALINVQKRELITTLAGGVAHNFNNFLAVIQGNAELGLTVSSSSHVNRYFHEILSASGKASELVKKLMKISRPQKRDKALFEIKKVVQFAVNTSKSILPANIELIDDIPNGLTGRIYGSALDVEQTILNLVTNARDALGDKEDGCIVVNLDHTCKGSPHCEVICAHAQDCPVVSSNTVLLTVADNGPGIPNAIQDKLFDPFFTTKEPDKGTGLGLASANQIVTQHGGAIWFKSSPDDGSCFFICLPLLDEAATPPVDG